MFTGIVEQLGTVNSVSPSRVVIDALPEPNDPWKIGESIAVDGCCLTLVSFEPHLVFELSEETWQRTSFKWRTAASKVNLERAMKAQSRFGGHIVQGHVDAVGTLKSVEETERAHLARFSVPSGSEKYLIDKGSIAINGVSLTIVAPVANEFDVWIVPHTWSNTSFSQLAANASVNLEFDVLAKYVEKLTSARRT